MISTAHLVLQSGNYNSRSKFCFVNDVMKVMFHPATFLLCPEKNLLQSETRDGGRRDDHVKISCSLRRNTLSEPETLLEPLPLRWNSRDL